MVLKTNFGYRLGSQVLIVFLGFLFACLGSVAEGTEVNGQIAENTVWDLQQSPFVLTGDIQIWNNSEQTEIIELRIEPGVEVDLNGFTIRVGNQLAKRQPVDQGRMIADRVRFFGKGNVILAYGKENHLSGCVFDSIHLLLGGKTGTISSGKLQNITMNHADITIYAGKWDIIGGKLLNGTISYKALNRFGMQPEEIQYMNFFMKMISLP